MRVKSLICVVAAFCFLGASRHGDSADILWLSSKLLRQWYFDDWPRREDLVTKVETEAFAPGDRPSRITFTIWRAAPSSTDLIEPLGTVLCRFEADRLAALSADGPLFVGRLVPQKEVTFRKQEAIRKVIAATGWHLINEDGGVETGKVVFHFESRDGNQMVVYDEMHGFIRLLSLP